MRYRLAIVVAVQVAVTTTGYSCLRDDTNCQCGNWLVVAHDRYNYMISASNQTQCIGVNKLPVVLQTERDTSGHTQELLKSEFYLGASRAEETVNGLYPIITCERAAVGQVRERRGGRRQPEARSLESCLLLAAAAAGSFRYRSDRTSGVLRHHAPGAPRSPRSSHVLPCSDLVLASHSCARCSWSLFHSARFTTACKQNIYHLGYPLVDDWPIMNAVKYSVVSGVTLTSRTMAISITNTNRTGVLALVCRRWLQGGADPKGFPSPGEVCVRQYCSGADLDRGGRGVVAPARQVEPALCRRPSRRAGPGLASLTGWHFLWHDRQPLASPPAQGPRDSGRENEYSPKKHEAERRAEIFGRFLRKCVLVSPVSLSRFLTLDAQVHSPLNVEVLKADEGKLGSTEQRRNASAKEMVDPRENPLTCGIVRHDFCV
ncbi:hypothetical protein PR048_010079 [Dryococelus australis]|uniref:Uncharacterized protein n=1 Tax=Dryococelus australis TaxID=614101 RepID=A0ABQ9I1Q2_9NEOP|nr:hypothetical protein PR048_010079 [Dryococelus australis]